MITFITGGARSGKSKFALNIAGKVIGKKAYIATAQALDNEMKERIERHRKERSERDSSWIIFEEPLNITTLIMDIHIRYNAILIDCLTLWLSNLMIKSNEVEREIKSLCSSLIYQQSTLFIVSNEVGLGIVPENALARKFRDMAGYLNQGIAEIADEVYFITAGIPLKIK